MAGHIQDPPTTSPGCTNELVVGYRRFSYALKVILPLLRENFPGSIFVGIRDHYQEI